jgi:ribosome-associated toxin RatA of RatAB toxin-antitoxin module
MASAERKETYKVDLEKFYGTLRDFASYPKFVSSMKRVEIQEQTDNTAKIFFEVEMMKKLAYTLNLKFGINEARNHAELSWTLGESAFFKVNNGSWKLQSMGPGVVDVTYKLELDFNFPVPGLILKGLVAKALPQAMNEFYEESKKRK